ncbi:hypothetical protein M5689_012381 [Euphorbia peplus]|nr:hypothetical protein M5689_012381 [Euphorbia peplus]
MAFPPGWRNPKLPKHSGTQDPNEHYARFKSLIILYTQDDRIMCKIFPTTLVKVSQEWYRSLPFESIDSFEVLKIAFVARFIRAVKARRISTDLKFLKQRPTEPLRDYLNRFQLLALQVKDLNVEVAINALALNTTCKEVKSKLIRKPPRKFEELMAIGQSHVRLDDNTRPLDYEEYEADKAGKSSATKTDKAKSTSTPKETVRHREEASTPYMHRMIDERERQSDRRVEVRYSSRVNTSHKHVDKDKKIADPKAARQTHDKKWCKYHNRAGLDTSECNGVKAEMNKIIERGATPRPNRGDTRARDRSPRMNEPKRLRVQCEIQVIRTGLPLQASVQCSKRQSEPGEALALQPAWRHVHSEALLVPLIVGDFKVHRILVDTGSSVSLLTWKAFSAMKIHPDNLRSGTFPLVGLADFEVPVMGMITLPCTFTDEVITETVDVD